MSGMKEYNKGFDAGYTGSPAGLPKTFAEAVGYNAGQAQRERQRAGGGGPGPQEAGPLTLPLVIFAGVLAIGMIAVMMGSSAMKAAYPAAAVVGLALTPLARRGLRAGTAVYVGALVGMLVGCVELAIASPELNFYNLRPFISLGAGVGVLVVVWRAWRKK